MSDMILTKDHGFQLILWISATRPVAKKDFQTYHINASSISPGYPIRDLIVSRQHRILLMANSGPGAKEVFIPAIKLAEAGLMTAGRFGPRDRFWHVLLPQHDVILSEGVYSESLFPGREALKMLSPISRASLVQSFDRSTYMMEFARQEIRRNPEVQEALSRPFRIATASDEDPSRDGINPPARAGKSPQRKIAMSHARSDIARSVYSVSPLT